MILKKPYAFLIKNFRLIHIILTVLIGYLLFRTYNIYTFFNRYVSNIYATLNDAMPSNYINIFMFLVAVAIVTFSLAMYLLMRKKDKPKTLYISFSIYYIVYFISLILYFVLFKSMETSQMTIRNAMIIRDITLIAMLPQIPLLILSFIRGVGFDIKKFNFSKDLKELDVSEEDNEEFEFVLGVDTYKYYRFIRRKIREFKYYILENKFMFTILMALLGGVLAIVLILNFTVYNRTYNANQRVNANNLVLKLNNSYITDVDYNGNKIKDNTYFVIANITFTNNSGLTTVLDLSNYALLAKNDKKYYPTLTRNNYFIDFGLGYSKEKIPPNTEINYILVYEIEQEDVAKKYTLRITDTIEYNAGTMNAKYKNISLKPLSYTSKERVKTYQLEQPITMYESILRNSSLTVNSYEFQNKYTYKYEACIRTNCEEVTDVVTADSAKSKKLMVINGILKLDENSTFRQNSKKSASFFDTFVQVRYDDKVSSVIDVTPASLKDKYILQVDERAASAKKLQLILTVRNKEYVLDLK